LEIGANVFRESSFRFDCAINRVLTPILLEGYFQSYRYFEQYGEEIANQLRRYIFKNITSPNETITVHLRRGDYLLDYNKSIHGIIDYDHLVRGVKFIRKAMGDELKAVIFSDDSREADFLCSLIPNSVVHDSFNENPTVVLGVMASASHFVLSNSSFGWWAGWLGTDEKKMVIVPRPWFASKNIDTSDLFPEQWIEMEVHGGLV
jgi:hypothetical protein